jgi:bifunctional DNase/RNase
MELSRIVISEASEEQIIVLREVDGPRSFPIVIGIYAAAAIDRQIRGITTPRPLTHDLVRNTVEAVGYRLIRMEVTELSMGTFYANLILADAEANEVRVDARPSDATAIALQAGIPIFVAESVLAEAGGVEPGTGDSDAESGSDNPSDLELDFGFDQPDSDDFNLFGDSPEE